MADTAAHPIAQFFLATCVSGPDAIGEWRAGGDLVREFCAWSGSGRAHRRGCHHLSTQPAGISAMPHRLPKPISEEHMPDGSAECGAILARLAALESLYIKHAEYVAGEVGAIKETLARIEKQRAEETGEKKGEELAYAKIGRRVTQVMATIGIIWVAFQWFTTGGGLDWIRKHFSA